MEKLDLKKAEDSLKESVKNSADKLNEELKNIITQIDMAVGLGLEWTECYFNISSDTKKKLEDAGYKLKVFEGYRLVVAWGEMPLVLPFRFNFPTITSTPQLYKFNEYNIPSWPYDQYKIICSTSNIKQ